MLNNIDIQEILSLDEKQAATAWKAANQRFQYAVLLAVSVLAFCYKYQWLPLWPLLVFGPVLVLWPLFVYRFGRAHIHFPTPERQEYIINRLLFGRKEGTLEFMISTAKKVAVTKRNGGVNAMLSDAIKLFLVSMPLNIVSAIVTKLVGLVSDLLWWMFPGLITMEMKFLSEEITYSKLMIKIGLGIADKYLPEEF